MRKQTLLLSAILLTASAAIACPRSADGTDGSTGSNISGTVTNASAKPVNKVTVVVSSPCLLKPQAVETDENGNFTIGQLEPSCVYKLTFEGSGYKKVTQEKVVVEPNQGTHLKVQLEPDCFWSGADHGTFSSQLQIFE